MEAFRDLSGFDVNNLELDAVAYSVYFPSVSKSIKNEYEIEGLNSIMRSILAV